MADTISRKIAAFMAARRRVWATVNYAMVTFSGGPLDGQKMQLENNGPSSTLPITIRDWVGVYEDGKWRGTEGTRANTYTEAPAPSASADIKPGYSLLTAFLCDLATEQTGEFATFKIQKTMFKIKNTPDAIATLRTRVLAKKTYFSDKAMGLLPATFTKEVSIASFALPTGNLQALATPAAPAAPVLDAPLPATTAKPAKPAKPVFCHALTKGVLTLARKRQRHLAAFQRGTLSSVLATKYSGLGLLDLAKNTITKRGAVLLAAAF